MKKKLLAAILAGTMAFSLTACGGKQTAPESGAETAATEAESENAEAATEDADAAEATDAADAEESTEETKEREQRGGGKGLGQSPRASRGPRLAASNKLSLPPPLSSAVTLDNGN